MAEKKKWLVRLGPMEWMRFTYARPPDDPMELLGSVSCGLQIGALALTTVEGEGEQYFQVVGDHITPLNTGPIKRALAKASKGKVEWRPPQRPGAGDAPAPVVVIKRKRKIAPP